MLFFSNEENNKIDNWKLVNYWVLFIYQLGIKLVAAFLRVLRTMRGSFGKTQKTTQLTWDVRACTCRLNNLRLQSRTQPRLLACKMTTRRPISYADKHVALLQISLKRRQKAIFVLQDYSILNPSNNTMRKNDYFFFGLGVRYMISLFAKIL